MKTMSEKMDIYWKETEQGEREMYFLVNKRICLFFFKKGKKLKREGY